ncbi:hypothetical protein OF83DRAFT_1064633 [Amylostereum chailletii]|nr:hypothetical protein OF83DRAFT_1064633 [Amylostereum chailletii]
MKFSSTTSLVSALVYLGGFTTLFASALSTPPVNSTIVARSVWAPPVISPKQGNLWKVGSSQTVMWDTQNPPSRVTNYQGKLLLGFLDGSGSEEPRHHPLAQGFDLRDGQANIVVPNVPSKDTYIAALIGDSGNVSPKFTIDA